MTTAVGMITRAMRVATVIGKGETPDADESADGLVALNAMLDSWKLDRLFVYRITENSFTLNVGFNSYTVGPGGNFNMDRPVKVEDSCFILLSNIQYAVNVVDEATFTAQQTVGQSQMPRVLYYDPASPLGTIFFDYKPDQAYNFHLKSRVSLQQFSTLTTVLTLPPGHEQAIVFSLAEVFGVEFGVAIPPKVEQIAVQSRAAIKRINKPSPVLVNEAAYMNMRNQIDDVRLG